LPTAWPTRCRTSDTPWRTGRKQSRRDQRRTGVRGGSLSSRPGRPSRPRARRTHRFRPAGRRPEADHVGTGWPLGNPHHPSGCPYRQSCRNFTRESGGVGLATRNSHQAVL
jgi:hypothetical protein